MSENPDNVNGVNEETLAPAQQRVEYLRNLFGDLSRGIETTTQEANERFDNFWNSIVQFARDKNLSNRYARLWIPAMAAAVITLITIVPEKFRATLGGRNIGVQAQGTEQLPLALFAEANAEILALSNTLKNVFSGTVITNNVVNNQTELEYFCSIPLGGIELKLVLNCRVDSELGTKTWRLLDQGRNEIYPSGMLEIGSVHNLGAAVIVEALKTIPAVANEHNIQTMDIGVTFNQSLISALVSGLGIGVEISNEDTPYGRDKLTIKFNGKPVIIATGSGFGTFKNQEDGTKNLLFASNDHIFYVLSALLDTAFSLSTSGLVIQEQEINFARSQIEGTNAINNDVGILYPWVKDNTIIDLSGLPNGCFVMPTVNMLIRNQGGMSMVMGQLEGGDGIIIYIGQGGRVINVGMGETEFLSRVITGVETDFNGRRYPTFANSLVQNGQVLVGVRG